MRQERFRNIFTRIRGALLCVLVTLLSGCSSTTRTPVTGVCKSCKQYSVRGSSYTPQRHYEYQEKGKASWYGPGFHGKPKATGERYNQHTLTAAHRTLPLPTIVHVKNLKTGRRIKLLVDDRGPYTYAGRIIDLSMAAAQELGTYSQGVGYVEVTSDVKESQALSNYLAKYGSKGRTWRQIYDEIILGKKSSHHSSRHHLIHRKNTPRRRYR